MEKIGLILDTTTYTREDIKNIDFIKTASLTVTVDGVDYSESELSLDQMSHFLHAAKKLTTSQPAPGVFLNLYQEFYNEGYTHVLVITLSDKLSGTFQSALIAKTMIDFDLDISVHSPQVASFGVALGIPPLIEMIQNGETFENIVKREKVLYENAVVMFTLQDLMHLFRGGRLSKVSAFIGTVLRIKPIIEMIDGRLNLTRKERTNIACFDYFMDRVDEYSKKYKNIYVDFIQMNRIEWELKFIEVMKVKYPNIKTHISKYVTPVFSVHLGEQGFGIAIVAE
ncbi:MAG: DegV family protein [Candidatus Izemoplasmatales bacterium]|jgi:DegV family protein with EDD domain|nr:DegV family protein [Candidatus Izemoplasmatales bacterium]